MAPYVDVVGYRRFGIPCCLHLQHGPPNFWMPCHSAAWCYNAEGSDLNLHRPENVQCPIGVREFDSQQRLEIFSSPTRPDRLRGPPSLLPNTYRGALPPEVKRQGREADHSSSSSAAVRKAWSYISTPQYVFMQWCLVKHRDNFTLLHLHIICTGLGNDATCIKAILFLFENLKKQHCDSPKSAFSFSFHYLVSNKS
jgi:hypothetical protein